MPYVIALYVIKERKLENLSSGTDVLYTTSNLVISRRRQDENGKEMYQNVKHTFGDCRAFVFVPVLSPLFYDALVAVVLT